MKKKLIIMTLIFIQVSMIFIFISTVQAADDYYIIKYFDAKKEPIKIKKTTVTDIKDKDKIYKLRDQLYNIDIEALSANGLLTLDKLLSDFYEGAYKNLEKEEYNSTYNKLWNQDSPTSVATRMIKAAPNRIAGRDSENPDNEKLRNMIKRRENGKNLNGTAIELPSSSAAGQSGEISGTKTEEQKEKEAAEKKTIYQSPEKIASTDSADSLDDMIGDADNFIAKGAIDEKLEKALPDFSTVMFNILLTVGVAVALVVGVIIGIKYMMGSIEEKANYKQMLVPYLVGCVVVFGAFGIWKLVVTIMENI